MDEYEFLTKIISDYYYSSDQKHLIEKDVQTVNITSAVGNKRLEAYSLYRFSIKESAYDFLSIFNKTHVAPKELRSFCDYIMLIEYNKTPYVILIEMKKNSGTAKAQLDASSEFFNYIKNTAERIKTKNNVTFDSTKIKTIKVKLTDLKTKRTTRGTNIEYEEETGVIIYTTRKFDILHVCDFYERKQTA